MTIRGSAQRRPAGGAKRGQVMVEYFILLAIIALMTVIGLKVTMGRDQVQLEKDARGSLERLMHRVAGLIAN